jgi:DNA modification methylase
MIVEGLLPLAADISTLQLLPGNPRMGDVAAVARSLEAFGQRKPIVAKLDGTVIAGNHTLQAARSLGWPEIAVVFVDDDVATAKAFALADNRTAELGGYDNQALADLIAEVQEADEHLLEATGWTGDDLLALLSDIDAAGVGLALTDPDDVPDAPTPRSVVGDVWILGRHRLVCGDATSSSVLDSLMGGSTAHMVWTDPPYGVSYVGGTKDKLSIMNDALGQPELHSLLVGAFSNFATHLRPGGAFYICAPSGDLETVFRLALIDCGLQLRQQLVWVKSSHVLSRADYHGWHETILYGWSDGDPFPVPDPEPVELPEGTALYEAGHLNMLYGWKDGAAHTWAGDRRQNTVWEFDKPAASRLHPTMKPVGLVSRGIRNGSMPGDLVLDPFAGSGSTLMACEGNGRSARLVELDPRYVDVICRRFQEHTGILPIAEASNREHDFAEG